MADGLLLPGNARRRPGRRSSSRSRHGWFREGSASIANSRCSLPSQRSAISSVFSRRWVASEQQLRGVRRADAGHGQERFKANVRSLPFHRWPNQAIAVKGALSNRSTGILSTAPPRAAICRGALSRGFETQRTQDHTGHSSSPESSRQSNDHLGQDRGGGFALGR
jgi:hypothetical protein